LCIWWYKCKYCCEFYCSWKTLFTTNCFLQRMKWSYLFSPWSIDASVDVPPVQRDQVDIVKDDAAQSPERFLQKKKLLINIRVFLSEQKCSKIIKDYLNNQLKLNETRTYFCVIITESKKKTVHNKVTNLNANSKIDFIIIINILI
jgi:hypothetical protein